MVKGLFIFLGESFRTGLQGSRIIGQENSIKGQLEACDSHVLFFNHLKDKFNININICLSTYTTTLTPLLIDKYSDFNVKTNIFDRGNLHMGFLFNSSLVQYDIQKFDFIFIIRIDLILKPYLYDVFIPRDKILFPFVQIPLLNKKNDLYWDIFAECCPDTMFYIPNKYYEYLKYVYWGL